MGHLKWKKNIGQTELTKNPECRILVFRSTGPRQKKKKIRAVPKCKVAFWPPPVLFLPPILPNTSQRLGKLISISLEQYLVRERGERSRIIKCSSWKQAAGWRDFQFGSPFSTFAKVFLYEILMLSTNFMCGELKYVKKIFYFGL